MNLRFPRGSRGFTLVEVLVAMTLTGIVVAGTLRALTAQKRFYARQARILDARHAMRASLIILSSELRETSAVGGDLYFVASDSIGLRSTVGFGVICALNVGAGVLSLRHSSGHFRLESGDSVLVYLENGPSDNDDQWIAVQVTSITTTGPACAFGSGADLHVTVGGNVAGAMIGAPVRLFRPYAYGLFSMYGRYWLGRRNMASGEDYVPVAGPLAPPSDNGLIMSYFDFQTRLPTNDRTRVGRIEIDVRAPTDRSLSDPAYRDLRTGTYLRNNI
jgi:prepilin-type N-terminal cleavage/methylation domain-containing protein